MNRQRGMTLLELVIAIVIVAAAAGTIVGLLYTMSRNSADVMTQSQGAAIANSYLKEILARPITDPDGMADSGRQNADNIDDYLNLPDDRVRNHFGELVPGMDNYRVNVAIAQAGIDGPGTNDVPANAARLVTVTVTDPLGAVLTFSGFRTQHP